MTVRPATAQLQSASPPRSRVLRRHHPISRPAAAVRAPEVQLDQRHVAAAGVHQGLQIGLALMAARLAPDQHAGIAGAQRRARCRQIIRAHLFRHRGAASKVSVCRKSRLGGGFSAIRAVKIWHSPDQAAATGVIGKVPPCRTVGRVASFRSETKGRVLQPPDMAQTASVTPLWAAPHPAGGGPSFVSGVCGSSCIEDEPRPEFDGPFDCCLVGARSGARWPRHPRRVHGMAAARRLKNIGMRGRKRRHKRCYCAQFWRGLGDGGMSHAPMRGKPALPKAAAMPMQMIIQRAPNQLIVPLGSPSMAVRAGPHRTYVSQGVCPAAHLVELNYPAFGVLAVCSCACPRRALPADGSPAGRSGGPGAGSSHSFGRW